MGRIRVEILVLGIITCSNEGNAKTSPCDNCLGSRTHILSPQARARGCMSVIPEVDMPTRGDLDVEKPSLYKVYLRHNGWISKWTVHVGSYFMSVSGMPLESDSCNPVTCTSLQEGGDRSLALAETLT